MPLPMPGGHSWSEFFAPVSGTNIAAETFGIPAFKDIHVLRELAPLVLGTYLDTTSGDLIPGDLVALLGGTGNDWKVIKTTTLGQTGMLGVILEPATHGDGLIHRAQFSGVVDVNVQMGVHTGNWLRCSATDGKAEVCLASDTGACMQALTESASTSGGQVTVLLYPSLATGIVPGGGAGGSAGWFVDSVPVPAEPQVDLIAGSNITLTPIDNTGAGRTEITIASSGGGGGGSGIGGSLAQVTAPTLSAMTQVNVATTTFIQDTHGVHIAQAPVGGHSVALAVRAISIGTPYHARCAFFAGSPPTFWYGGLILRESATGKLILWGVRGDGTLAAHYYSDAVTFGSFIAGGGTPAPAAMKSNMWWFEIYDDGTNRHYRMLSDGRYPVDIIASELNTAHFVPDQFGFGVNGAGAVDGPQLLVTHLDCSAAAQLTEIA